MNLLRNFLFFLVCTRIQVACQERAIPMIMKSMQITHAELNAKKFSLPEFKKKLSLQRFLNHPGAQKIGRAIRKLEGFQKRALLQKIYDFNEKFTHYPQRQFKDEYYYLFKRAFISLVLVNGVTLRIYRPKNPDAYKDKKMSINLEHIFIRFQSLKSLTHISQGLSSS